MNNTAEIVKFKSKHMPSNNGFIKVWRDIRKQEWYSNPDCVALFYHLMISAAHQPMQYNFKGVNVMLNTGEYATTYEDLANVFGLNKSRVRRIVAIFVKNGQIKRRQITQGRINKGLVLSLMAWNKWQKSDNLADTPPDTPPDTPETANLKGLKGYADTPPDTPPDTINKNALNKNILVPKGTCQNSKEFSPAEQPKVPVKEITQLFAEILPSLPQPKKITESRRKVLKARHVNDLKSSLEKWRGYFEYIRDNCAWMISGQYNVDFDYVIRQSTFVKVCEGAKDDR